MAVYYKFKSARDYDSVQLDGAFISVGALKEKIFESKHLGRGTDFDLVVTNAQTNEEYLDEAMLIPKNTSVLIRRVPGRPRMTIVTEQEPNVESKIEEVQPEKSSVVGLDSSTFRYQNDDSEWDEFGNDLYALPEEPSVETSNPIPDAAPTNRADEEDKLKALINTPALDWQRQGADSFGPGRGYGRGAGGRFGGRGGFGMERKTPPEGYVCFRCNVPGHFIQHCPTNGDPSYDVKRVKQPTGIPKSMLITSTDGSYALPNGSVAVLKPNEDAFEREMEGLPSTTRSVGELPPELRCPLCKEVMKDAVLTSKCCFNSFCDKCIRDHIISKSMCVCGAANVLADDLLPNKTVRDTINRILEAGTSSAENVGSAYQVQDMESARDPQPKIPSPTMSSASKGDEKPPIKISETQTMNPNEVKISAPPPQQISDKGKIPNVPDVGEATHDVAASQGSGLPLDEEVQQKAASSEAGKKKKKKKVRVHGSEMQQWRNAQDFPADNNYMMPPAPSAAYNNPYWNGMPPFMDGGYMGGPYNNGMPYNMGYAMGPMDMQFMGLMPPDPFSAPGYNMMPPFAPRPPLQRNLPGFSMGMNNNGPPPPVMSREEFEARKADLRRKRENDSRMESWREGPKDRDYGRDMSSAGNVSFMQAKKSSGPGPVSSTSERYRDKDRHRSERPSPTRSRDSLESPPRAAKRKLEHRERDRDRYDRDYHDRPRQSRHESSSSKRLPSSEPPLAAKPAPPAQSSSAAAAAAAAAAEHKKASVFSRIRLPENEAPKKRNKVEPAPLSNGYSNYEERKSSSSSTKVSTAPASGSGGGRKRSSTVDDYESSDDEERHFKRKPSRYEPSPPPVAAMEWEEEESRREARGSRERSRDRDRKHR